MQPNAMSDPLVDPGFLNHSYKGHFLGQVGKFEYRLHSSYLSMLHSLGIVVMQ